MKSSLSIVILSLLFIQLSYCALNQNVGCIEGYYWTPADSVNGQYGEYSFTQRKQLIQFMASSNIGLYLYSPQTVNTMQLWNSTQLSEWKEVSDLASKLGVKVVVGIRPGWLESSAFSNVLKRLEQIHSIGVTYYSLNFDDAEGVDTIEQQQLEVQLVTYLNQNLASTMKLYSMLPFAYYQEKFNSRTEWETELETIDNVPSNISFVFTGTKITPNTFDSSQFPTLKSGRNLKFFDNWIAGDTSERISWGMIDGRVNSNIYTSSYGYILNLAFPLERIIHHLYCEGQLASGFTSCDIGTAAQVWTDWLNDNGFLHENQTVSNVKSSLEEAIKLDGLSINELYTEFPILNGIFTTPPTTQSSSSSSSSSSSNSDSSADGSSTNEASSFSNLIINSTLSFIILVIINLIY